MNAAEFLDDIEQRVRANGGAPVSLSGPEIMRLHELAFGKKYQRGPGVMGRGALKRVRLARARIIAEVTERLVESGKYKLFCGYCALDFTAESEDVACPRCKRGGEVYVQ